MIISQNYPLFVAAFFIAGQYTDGSGCQKAMEPEDCGSFAVIAWSVDSDDTPQMESTLPIPICVQMGIGRRYDGGKMLGCEYEFFDTAAAAASAATRRASDLDSYWSVHKNCNDENCNAPKAPSPWST